jgi:hypothetical protein
MRAQIASCWRRLKSADRNKPVAGKWSLYAVVSAALLVTSYTAWGRSAGHPETQRTIAPTAQSSASGTRHLVSGTVRGGPAFAIVGVSKRATRKNALAVTVDIAQPGPRPGSTGGPSSTLSTTSAQRRPLRLQFFTGCAGANAYVIAYGVLRAKGARVLIHATGRTAALRHLRLPNELDPGAELVYAAVPWVPSSVVVRSGRRSLIRQSYGALADEQCPGGQGSTTGTIG